MSHPLVSAGCLAAMFAFSSVNAFAAGELTQESPSQWRASKLSGVMIYGPDNRSVGKISDVLMSKDGKAEYVIIGVGGFLGIDQKDVAIPYGEVKFTDVPMTPPMNPAPATGNMATTAPNAMTGATATGTGAMANGTVATSGGVPTSTALGMGTTGNTATDGTMGAPMARSTAYPDHGTIDMTAAQLKNAPTFHFAS
ncbi:PRC-barrel domain-containing protein [Lichenifustis flavocetrariae]|uniref:PRC-barrel domain-containing protein n=1 Tax=Lichenifustis flavocetrariae TaxID=2949735 RepID=A0AA42CNR7_9HYPH|nr:PRC-barrel domain-containing protein [Lichenifustis flavocetrariae]MCW6509650.1 PRC-barrel domain-containing protein [Lichenifustis flavocetrariae]